MEKSETKELRKRQPACFSKIEKNPENDSPSTSILEIMPPGLFPRG